MATKINSIVKKYRKRNHGRAWVNAGVGKRLPGSAVLTRKGVHAPYNRKKTTGSGDGALRFPLSPLSCSLECVVWLLAFFVTSGVQPPSIVLPLFRPVRLYPCVCFFREIDCVGAMVKMKMKMNSESFWEGRRG